VPPENLSGMTRGWAYGNEAADGRFLSQLLLAIRAWFTRRAQLEAEDVLLRQQLVVLWRKSAPAEARSIAAILILGRLHHRYVRVQVLTKHT
jgi:hypothetical protein